MPLDSQEAAKRMATFQKGAKKDSGEFFKEWLGVSKPQYGWLYSSASLSGVGRAFRELGILRKPLFVRAVQGKLGAAVARALSDAAELPYQVGMSRQPFRAPREESLVDINRGKILAAAFTMSQEWNEGPAFFAEWSGYIPSFTYGGNGVELILAGAIDSGDQAVYDTLVQTVRGQHPTAVLSRITIRALLRCHKPEAMGEIERLLLGTQREEGLRQTIFESVDELRPEALPRFLRLVIEHNLLRFSSVYRAFVIWLPGLWQEGDVKSGAKVMGRLLDFLGSTELQPENEATDVYLRLWADAFYDIQVALKRSEAFLRNSDVAVRRAAARILLQSGVTLAFPLLRMVVQDPDHTVASIAVAAFGRFQGSVLKNDKHFRLLLKVAEGWPKGKIADVTEKAEVWDLVESVTPAESLHLLAPSVQEMGPYGRQRMGRRVSEVSDVAIRRDLVLKLVADTSADVRETALIALAQDTIKPREAPVIEDLLRRKAADLRQSALKLLRDQESKDALASGERLLLSKDRQQRSAGLELLSVLATEDKIAGAKERVAAYAAKSPELEGVEKNLVERVMGSSSAGQNEEAVLASNFGLFTWDQLTFCPRPDPTGVKAVTDSCLALLRSLDALIDGHRNEEVTYPRWSNWDTTSAEMVTVTVGSIDSMFPRPLKKSYELERERFPLAHLAEPWLNSLPAGSFEADGLGLFRGSLVVNSILSENKAFAASKHGPQPSQDLKAMVGLKHATAVAQVLPWLLLKYPPEVKGLLDILADRVASTADDSYKAVVEQYRTNEQSWRTERVLAYILATLTKLLATHPDQFGPEETIRFYRLLRFIDEPMGISARPEVDKYTNDPEKPRSQAYDPNFKVAIKEFRFPKRIAPFPELLDATFTAGGCTAEDVLDVFCNWDSGEPYAIRMATRRGMSSDEFRQVAQRFVDRLVTIESARGELPTVATKLLGGVKSGIHLPHLRQLLAGNVALSQGAGGSSRAASFAQIFAVSRPAADETPDICAAAFIQDKVKPDRLLELAMFAPQWSAAVELALGWPGLADAVWWIHAHTKDEKWGTEKEIKDLWEGEISERTPLTSQNLVNGAADVAWFLRFRSKFDDKRWAKIEGLAKLASSGSGHMRAKLFAQAMTGAIVASDLFKRIEEKRTGDAVRALGLVPLSEDRDDDIRKRYAVMQEFLRTSRTFGAMKQASEKMAVSIGLENLASTAGYPDSLRLTWALEAAEVEDLQGKGRTEEVDDVQIRLFFDPNGDPQIETTKSGKPVKDIPASAKKAPGVKALTERRTGLKKQAQRMRIALEQAMQRGDEFEAGELVKLMAHPGLAPMLANLVFQSDSGKAGFLSPEGKLEGEEGRLIVAHPYDLLKRGDWPEWQHAVFAEERVQPFKQLFRELYTLTESEKEGVRSTRYAGHQLQPRQALGILSKRGWVLRQEEGLSKTLHESGLTARLDFEENFYSPADVEGLTMESLHFTRSGTWQGIRLTDVPPKAFSETMRDLDLIVSVASMLGIDPEASESTVEMRASVVRELVLLMKMGNVSLTPNHAVIAGKLGEYTVHLGSGIVHQRAKGELVILAVRQPQRGRMFLPFMDDDPRTAEIASKVLLLARDSEMKDPSILSQIVS